MHLRRLSLAVGLAAALALPVVYVVDLRNGLYILRYDGELSGAVKDTAFLEGGSNVGQVLAAEAASR